LDCDGAAQPAHPAILDPDGRASQGRNAAGRDETRALRLRKRRPGQGRREVRVRGASVREEGTGTAQEGPRAALGGGWGEHVWREEGRAGEREGREQRECGGEAGRRGREGAPAEKVGGNEDQRKWAAMGSKGACAAGSSADGRWHDGVAGVSGRKPRGAPEQQRGGERCGVGGERGREVAGRRRGKEVFESGREGMGRRREREARALMPVPTRSVEGRERENCRRGKGGPGAQRGEGAGGGRGGGRVGGGTEGRGGGRLPRALSGPARKPSGTQRRVRRQEHSSGQ